MIRFPVFNATQSAHAEAADYEALKARKQAEEVKNQVTSEAMKLHQSVRQLAAAPALVGGIVWDGKASDGGIVRDGLYRLIASSGVPGAATVSFTAAA